MGSKVIITASCEDVEASNTELETPLVSAPNAVGVSKVPLEAASMPLSVHLSNLPTEEKSKSSACVYSHCFISGYNLFLISLLAVTSHIDPQTTAAAASISASQKPAIMDTQSIASAQPLLPSNDEKIKPAIKTAQSSTCVLFLHISCTFANTSPAAMNLIRPQKAPAGPRLVNSLLAPRVLPNTASSGIPSTPTAKSTASALSSTAGSNNPSTSLSKDVVLQADQARGRQQLSRGEIAPSTAYLHAWEHTTPKRIGLLQKMQQTGHRGQNLFPQDSSHQASSPMRSRSFQPVQLASSPSVETMRIKPVASASTQASPSLHLSIQSAPKSYGSLGVKPSSNIMDSVEINSFSRTQRAQQPTEIESSTAVVKKPNSRRRTTTAPVKAPIERIQTRSRKTSSSAAGPSDSAPGSSKSNARRASETDFPAAKNARKRAKKSTS